MHPFKNFLRLSFLPRTRARASPWKGKSVEIGPCSVHCHDEYHLSWGIPPPAPEPELAPLPLQNITVVNVKVGDDDPSLFSDSDSDIDMAVNEHDDEDLHDIGIGASGSSSRLVRVVSWASILSHRCRWTRRQERDLAIAESELKRCQKAWSSEQEVWLVYIKALTEEKEAHEEFLYQRAKQQDDEQQHFRKSWDRRRSGSHEYQRRQSFPISSHGGGKDSSRLRWRLRRQGTI
ncbi:uncharacterized protein KD926_002121 [Aspergillus affinis]|uniref:uncharacterized protein n=1 Tax=Aspergillus affinis TaxID=1070780 RepID=UPI0022FEA465|nr:uncharacterized protein KD926_002121 [Aspergillus affinis]KAI9036303.1 hypothetical protein KD926_002121 [Aspergillus affinis]